MPACAAVASGSGGSGFGAACFVIAEPQRQYRSRRESSWFCFAQRNE